MSDQSDQNDYSDPVDQKPITPLGWAVIITSIALFYGEALWAGLTFILNHGA